MERAEVTDIRLPDLHVIDEGEMRLLADSAQAFASAHPAVNRLRAGNAGFDAGVWAAMADQGWLGMCLSEGQGGLGMDVAAAAVLTESFGAALLPEPFIALSVMPSVLLGATQGTAPDLAAGLSAGQRLATVAWQEAPEELGPVPGHTRLEAGGRLQGRKVCVPGTTVARELLVSALQDGASVLVRVDVDHQGVRIEHVRLIDGSLMGVVTFEAVQVAAGDVLAQGPQVEQAMARMVAGAQLALAAQLYGVAKTSLEISARYMETRSQFGGPIARFQALRHRLVDLKIGLERTRAALAEARRPNRTPAAVSAAKALASEAAVATSRTGIQLHGAMGFSDEADIGLYHKAALTGAAWLGSARLHRASLAQYIGSDHEAA